jgi:hypothetical protein
MAIAQFFMNLEVHPYWLQAYGEQALMAYQAQVRREWHDRLKQNEGFNMATINEDLLQTIHHDIMNKRLADTIEVSTVSFLFTYSTNQFFIFPSPSNYFLPTQTPLTTRKYAPLMLIHPTNANNPPSPTNANIPCQYYYPC